MSSSLTNIRETPAHSQGGTTDEPCDEKRRLPTKRRSSRRALTPDQRRALVAADTARREEARTEGRKRERPDLAWFVIYTNPLCERRVELGLLALGLCAYLPEGRRWFRPRRAAPGAPHAQKLRVAFPRYVFVSFPGAARPDIRCVDGVAGLVGSGGKHCEPMTVTNKQITALRMAQETGQLDFGKNPTRYEVGQKVEILHPLMRGAEGVVISGKIGGGYRIDIPGWFTTTPIFPVDFLREAA